MFADYAQHFAVHRLPGTIMHLAELPYCLSPLTVNRRDHLGDDTQSIIIQLQQIAEKFSDPVNDHILHIQFFHAGDVFIIRSIRNNIRRSFKTDHMSAAVDAFGSSLPVAA